MDNKMEMAQLLVRFKLQVKRSLGESIDLERMSTDQEYARQRLKDIEDSSEDEALLVMVVRLRDYLGRASSTPAEQPGSANKSAPMRSYTMGARAW